MASLKVEDIMTRDVVVGLPEDTVDYVMEIMTRNRIRHLPVVDDGWMHGILSIGDVVDALRTKVEVENRLHPGEVLLGSAAPGPTRPSHRAAPEGEATSLPAAPCP